MKPITHYWQSRNPLALLLFPLSLLYCAVVRLRGRLYRLDWLKRSRLPVPVLVVGNVSVGGTGKTPLTVWLTQTLIELGYRPGILIRGYKGKAEAWPQRVYADSNPEMVGDEAVLLARRTGVPVMAGADRAQSGKRLLQDTDCDLLVCDDGLQHLGLRRDLEIAVIDAARGLGNGFCLPAGPLREPPSRLATVDLIIHNGEVSGDEIGMALLPGEAINLSRPDLRRPLGEFSGEPVAALAGIGNPERFFSMLRRLGLQVDARPLADHHEFVGDDLHRKPGQPLLMTEKDAVKCAHWADEDCWYVPVEAQPDERFREDLIKRLEVLKKDG